MTKEFKDYKKMCVDNKSKTTHPSDLFNTYRKNPEANSL